MGTSIWSRGTPILIAMALLSCAGTRPAHLGLNDGRLAPCPSSPNCVCSDGPAGEHFVEPLFLRGDAEAAWQAAKQAVAAMPRTEVVESEPGYLHAECRSALLGFVDDLELRLHAAEGTIAIRSASRLGWSDMGVNRRRVEALREELAARGVLR
jgi:uncharacterized protein (DUF1499 family)